MLKSMTGYGRGEYSANGRSYLVEIKSVNNRYLDCNIRLPRIYTCAEDSLLKLLKDKISRGKVEVFVTVEHTEQSEISIELNESVVAGYVKALNDMAEKFELRNDMSTSLLSRFQDVFLINNVPENLETLTADLCKTLATAIDDFDKMRTIEGEKLADDVYSRLETIEQYVEEVEKRSPERIQAYYEKLTAKIKEILEDRQIDESRILTEAAIYADKLAVDEETVRLRSHISQFREMLNKGSPIGRKLDFLVQEMNRETNTIGSKANDIDMSKIVVDIKAEIEKIREQIQNIE